VANFASKVANQHNNDMKLSMYLSTLYSSDKWYLLVI